MYHEHTKPPFTGHIKTALSHYSACSDTMKLVKYATLLCWSSIIISHIFTKPAKLYLFTCGQHPLTSQPVLSYTLPTFSCYDSVYILTCLCWSQENRFFPISLYKWIQVTAPVSSMYLLNSLSLLLCGQLDGAFPCYSIYRIIPYLSKYKLHFFPKVMLL
jgi:hypothetical protein